MFSIEIWKNHIQGFSSLLVDSERNLKPSLLYSIWIIPRRKTVYFGKLSNDLVYEITLDLEFCFPHEHFPVFRSFEMTKWQLVFVLSECITFFNLNGPKSIFLNTARTDQLYIQITLCYRYIFKLNYVLSLKKRTFKKQLLY